MLDAAPGQFSEKAHAAFAGIRCKGRDRWTPNNPSKADANSQRAGGRGTTEVVTLVTSAEKEMKLLGFTA